MTIINYCNHKLVGLRWNDVRKPFNWRYENEFDLKGYGIRCNPSKY